MNSAIRLWCVDFYVNTTGVVVQMGAMLKSLLRLVVKVGRHVPEERNEDEKATATSKEEIVR